MAQTVQIHCYITGCQFACTLPWKRKSDAEDAWETTSPEESSLCAAGPRKNRLSCTGEGLTVPRQVLEAVVPTQLLVLLLWQTWRTSSLCTCPSAKAQQGLARARELLCFTQPYRAVTCHPSSCAGSSSVCVEVMAQLHMWFRQCICRHWPWVQGTLHSSGRSAVVQVPKCSSKVNTKALLLVLFCF